MSRLEEHAARADEKFLDRLLKRVPDRPAAPGDELPERKHKPKRNVTKSNHALSTREKRSEWLYEGGPENLWQRMEL